jgi:porin
VSGRRAWFTVRRRPCIKCVALWLDRRGWEWGMRVRALKTRLFRATALLLQLTAWASGATAQDAEPPYADSCHDPLVGNWKPRADLKDAGVTFCVNYTADAHGNVSGGIRHGGTYEGRLEVSLDANLETLWSWNGASFHVSADQIHGRGLSANYLGNNILTANGNEAERATRLFTLWLQEENKGTISVKIGQLAADDDFIVSSNAALFVNSTFGWPGKEAVDLPSGGPVYPLSTPGAEMVVGPKDQGPSFWVAVFNGDPAGPGPGTPQSRDAGGTPFRLNDGAFAIAEFAYRLDGSDRPDGLKLGGWYHSGRFADQRFDSLGRSLADPTSSHIAARHRGDYGLYAIVDCMIWPKRCDQEPNDNKQGLEAFLRLGASPSDRNLVDYYADGGLTYAFDDKGMDAVGLGIAYARISDAATGLDRDARFFSGAVRPIRDHELAVELTYHAQPKAWPPWLLVQPDLQFILHPGGHVPDPTDPTGRRAIRNAVVIGMRTGVSF